MSTTSILIKTDSKVKQEAQKTAKGLGLSLNAVLNGLLQQFIQNKTITFSAKRLSEEPSDYLIETLKKSEEDIKAGRVSPEFHNTKDAIAWLNR